MHPHDHQLTLVKGGRIASRDFISLPLGEKLQLLRTRPVKERLELILADPAGRTVVREFAPLELYFFVKEVGEQDALELIHFAAAEQFSLFLDLELWPRCQYSSTKAMQWLGYLLDGGEEQVVEFFLQADQELLTLIFMKEITVGGGLGVLASDEERLSEWEHSFDNLYFFTIRNREHAELISQLLDIMYRLVHPLYLEVMEGVKNETTSEAEELSFQFRSGRLADQGFPDPDDALALYAYVRPASYVPRGGKEFFPAAPSGTLPVPHLKEGSLLQRVLARCGSEEVFLELNYLINNVLVADGADFTEEREIEGLFQRAYGYLNIALEYLSSGSDQKAEEILAGEYLKDLFRLGFSLILELQRNARKHSSTEYVAARVLKGLATKRPRFYRGLDPDGIDGYREFRELADIRNIAELLHHMEEG